MVWRVASLMKPIQIEAFSGLGLALECMSGELRDCRDCHLVPEHMANHLWEKTAEGPLKLMEKIVGRI